MVLHAESSVYKCSYCNCESLVSATNVIYLTPSKACVHTDSSVYKSLYMQHCLEMGKGNTDCLISITNVIFFNK